MSMTQHGAETAVGAAAKVTPPVTVVGADIAGVPVPEVVQWLTLVYLLLLIAHHVWKWWRESRSGTAGGAK